MLKIPKKPICPECDEPAQQAQQLVKTGPRGLLVGFRFTHVRTIADRRYRLKYRAEIHNWELWDDTWSEDAK